MCLCLICVSNIINRYIKVSYCSLLLIFSPELVTAEFKVDVELYQSQPVENNSKSPSTPVKVFKKLKKVCCLTKYVLAKLLNNYLMGKTSKY